MEKESTYQVRQSEGLPLPQVGVLPLFLLAPELMLGPRRKATRCLSGNVGSSWLRASKCFLLLASVMLSNLPAIPTNH